VETVETLDYIKGSNRPNKVHYSFVQLYTHSLHRALRLTVLVFSSPKIDLSVGVQTAFRAPFVFVISGVISGERQERRHRESGVGVS